MQSAHPLEIPEIISHVASFVRKRNLTTYALVSKSWYQAFNPFIWHDISWKGRRPGLPEAIHRHTQFVRTFKAGHYIHDRMGLLDLTIPNLVSLDLLSIQLGGDMKEWVLGHSSLTRLRLDAYNLNSVFWSTLLGLRHLKDLTVWSRLELSEDDVDTFWQLCTHLERLEIIGRPIPQQGNLLSMTFPSITKLELVCVKDDSIMEFIQRCPNLTSFKYVGEECARFAHSFSELVTARIWLHLHSISIVGREIAEDAILGIIGGMQRIDTFKINYSPNSFGSNAMELLRPHSSNIRVLYLRSGLAKSSRIAQAILSSCPLLEQLTAPPIDASVVAKGKSWVCTRLQELELMFVYEDSTLPHLQPLVFDQLARLVRLEEWCMGYPSRRLPHQVVDLTLENELGKLSTLRSLRSIDLGNTYQEMGQQEIDWILEHWTNLENISGCLNTRTASVNEMLKERLKEHGITR